MIRRWTRHLAILGALATSTVAMAASKIGVVNFQEAVAETNDGLAEKARLESLTATRQAEVQGLEAELERKVEDYKARSMILSPEARQQTEQDLMRLEGELRQKAAMIQQELQQEYMKSLGVIEQKLQTVTQELGREQGYDLIVAGSMALPVGTNVPDLTDEVVRRYNAKK